jgi:hypothetical protein
MLDEFLSGKLNVEPLLLIDTMAESNKNDCGLREEWVNVSQPLTKYTVVSRK